MLSWEIRLWNMFWHPLFSIAGLYFPFFRSMRSTSSIRDVVIIYCALSVSLENGLKKPLMLACTNAWYTRAEATKQLELKRRWKLLKINVCLYQWYVCIFSLCLSTYTSMFIIWFSGKKRSVSCCARQAGKHSQDQTKKTESQFVAVQQQFFQCSSFN